MQPLPPAPVDAPGGLQALPAGRQGVLRALRREGPLSLADLAARLGVSRAAAHKHIVALESDGLIQRENARQERGRPRLVVRLAPTAHRLFPKAYADLTCGVLQFVEQRLGRAAVADALRERQKQLRPGYQEQMSGDLRERVATLAKVRDAEGYMAESKRLPGGAFEILEHNCPILAVADRYAEACTTETEMFRAVLRADVEVTHRTVAGDGVCRFLVRPRREATD